MTARRFAELEAARRRREVATTVISLLASWTVLLTVYFLLGLVGQAALTALGVLGAGGLLFGMSLTRQFRKVVAAELPELRAVQALGTLVVLFLVLFASAYLALATGSFSEPLDRVSALYFTVTVFSTVGFGDITPTTDVARIVVAIQMLLDLLLIGVIVRMFVSAVRSGLSNREGEGEAGTLGDEAPGAPPR